MEESIIDHVIISEDLVDALDSITIDEEGNNALTKIIKTKKGLIKQTSDHNSIITKFNIRWSNRVKKPRIEMFNLKT